MVHLRCFCYSACKDIVFPAKTMIAPAAASYRPNPLLLARRSISYRGMVPRSISIRPEPDFGWFETSFRYVRNVSAGRSERMGEWFGTTHGYVPKQVSGGSECTQSSSEAIGEYFRTTHRYVRSYPSGSKEPPDGCLRATHRVV